MKTGIELAKLQIEKNGYSCFEIQGIKGQTIAAQLEESLKPSDAIAELEQISEALPPGRYTLILCRYANKDLGKVNKGTRGSGAVEIPLNILHNSGHIDIGSHNATANLGNREYRELINEIKELEKKLLLLEIENQRLKAEGESGGINGVINNPGVQNFLAVLAQSYMSKNTQGQ